jgi:hypothetical protein
VITRIYLAGPMSGYEMWNYPTFDTNARWLRDMGYEVMSPAELSRDRGFDERTPSHQFSDNDYHESMLRNYAALLQCDAVALLPGWESSTGATLERRLASQVGLTFFRVDASRNYFERELVIGISGYAQSGKDTLANLMVEHMGFQRQGFADALRQVLYALNPLVDDGTTARPLVSIIDEMGWNQAKTTYPEVRSLMQRMGTEGAREHITQDIWSMTVLELHPHGPRLVIPDCRFLDESDAIHRRNGYVIRIDRKGVGPANKHLSENVDTNPDFVITNDGDPFEMLVQVRELLGDV